MTFKKKNKIDRKKIKRLNFEFIIQETNPILYFLAKSPFYRNIFVSNPASRSGYDMRYSTQTTVWEGYPVIRSLDVTLPREPRFNFYGAPIAHPRVSRRFPAGWKPFGHNGVRRHPRA